jgi:hypothetical protein
MADFIGYLASLATLKKAVVMLEQWEQANLELRGHIQVLIRRLERVGGYVDMRLPRFRRVSRGLELRRTKNVFTSRHVIHFYSTIEYVLRQTFCNVRWSPAFSYWSGLIYPSVECRRIRL